MEEESGMICIQEMKESLSKKEFHKFNTTALGYIWYSCAMSLENSIYHNVAMELFKEYIEWRKTKEPLYFSNTCMESIYTADQLQIVYNYFVDHPLTKEIESDKVLLEKFKKDYSTFIAKFRFDYTLVPVRIFAQEQSKNTFLSSIKHSIDSYARENPGNVLLIVGSVVFLAGIATGAGVSYFLKPKGGSHSGTPYHYFN